MALGAHMRPYSYMYCAPHRDGVLQNLLNFKDIRRNGYHIETMNKGSKKSIYITCIVYDKKLIMEKFSAFSFGLYHTDIKPIESYVILN